MTATLALAPPELLSEDSRRGKLFVPVLIYIGLLVAVVSSLGSPLVPTIATDYGVAVSSAQWSLTITLLVGALASPVIGRLGDGPHRRPVLLTALGVLVLGSVLAGLPGNFAMLLIGRGMQGVGLALLPLAMSVARDHLAPARARTALATLSVTTVVGVGLGYPITGFVAEHLSFHAAFWMAAALGVVAMAATAAVVPHSVHRPPQVFDLAGAVLLSLGVAGLLVGLSEGERWGWASLRLWLLVAVAVVLLVTWGRHESRTAAPLVDLRLMRHRTLLTANVTALLAGVGMYMLMAMIIRFVQTPTSVSYGLGASVVVSGFVLLPMSAMSLSASSIVSYATRWIGVDRVLPIGAMAFAVSLLCFGFWRDQLWEIFVIMGVAGLGVGSLFAVLPRLIVSSVPAHETGSALALNQVLRTIGFSIGSVLSATILTAHTVAPDPLPTDRGYTVGAVVALALCVITAVVSWLLPPRRPRPTPLAPAAPQEQLEVIEGLDAAAAGLLLFESESASGSGPRP